MDVAEVPAGDFIIGNDSIPNAGPRVPRRIDASFWIDTRPVTWDHFEVFVAGGGYGRTDLWNIAKEINAVRASSVDTRICDLFALATKWHDIQSHKLSDPVIGLTWFEATAVAAFFGARLPYEIEWEIAHSIPAATHSSTPQPQGNRSQFGCEIFIGKLQEWTLDAYSRMYFRADYRVRGVPWGPHLNDIGVVVRGAAPEDLYQHVSYRTMAAPELGHAKRGFRRVWDVAPSREQIEPSWRN